MNRILVIQTAFIGDAVLASSVLETLHRDIPEAETDLVVRKGNESVYAEHPFIGHLYVWDKKRKYKSLFEIVGEVRRKKYDLVVNLQRFGSTGLMAALSGGKEIRGFDKNPFSRFFTRIFSHQIGDGTHEIKRNHSVISDLTSNEPAPPRLYPSAEDVQKVSAFRSEPYVCIAPASVWFTKQYPEEGWIDFLNQLPQKYKVYILGSPADGELADRLIKKTSNLRIDNLCGELSLLQSAELMRTAEMNYVNDSAPLHLCSSVNAPVAVVFCSTVPEFGFEPLSDRSFVVETSEKMDCRPCGLHGKKSCPLGHFNCARFIKTEQLLQTLNYS